MQRARQAETPEDELLSQMMEQWSVRIVPMMQRSMEELQELRSMVGVRS